MNHERIAVGQNDEIMVAAPEPAEDKQGHPGGKFLAQVIYRAAVLPRPEPVATGVVGQFNGQGALDVRQVDVPGDFLLGDVMAMERGEHCQCRRAAQVFVLGNERDSDDSR